MSDTMDSYRTWIEAVPKVEGFSAISSARAYAHDETQYDNQYQVDPGALQPGFGAVSAAIEFSGNDRGPVLEIGCGTGLATVGLVAASRYREVLVTDPSPAFLAITKAKIDSLGETKSQVRYAILLGDELDRLPADTFSLIVLRSTLHHIHDVGAFLRQCARILAPGGVLAVQEPCAQGYLMMGALAGTLPNLAKAAGVTFEKEELRLLKLFSSTMQRYHRRDLDKSEWEDKHLFELAELSNIAAGLGMSSRFYVNQDFEALPTDLGKSIGKYDFYNFFRAYLQYCMSFPMTLIEKLDGFAKPYFNYVTEASAGGSWPQVTASCFFRKNGAAEPAKIVAPDLEYPSAVMSGGADFRRSYAGEGGFINEQHAGIFEHTKDIPGWAMEGDSLKQYELAYHSGDVILEIGTYGGRSAVCELLGALANPAREGRTFFYGVDINRDSIKRTFDTLNQWKLSPYTRLFQGDLQEFFARYPISPTMVFVDGDHRYEGVKADCDTLTRMLDVGVPVLFHDFLNPENDDGSY
ncbi:MAG TPA: class I SAM-dependent methyltransferase, partial [Chthoniobacterales bacterium]|nr:class I SAM-dependent methyltransferase [Chthoniobacterales bacterium]